MQTKCTCGERITKVWAATDSPMPPGDLGGCVQTERKIQGSCSNGCAPVNLGSLPMLSVLEQPLLTIKDIRKALGLVS